MNVFILDADTDYSLVHAGNSEVALTRMERASGHRAAKNWEPPQLYSQVYRKKPTTMWVDCLALVIPTGSDILLNRFAIAALSALLVPSCELLPVKLADQEYYWVNCFTTLNGVVDNVATRGKKFKYGDVQGWKRVTNWAFHADRLADAPCVFRVPESLAGRLFCTDDVVNAIRRAGLIGFKITKVWSSAIAETDDPPMSFPEDYEVPPYRPNEIKAKRKAAAKALKGRQDS